MTYEDRCPECKNTNGEHKPFCTRWTDEARLFGLRQCDFDDLKQGEVISRAGAVYGLNTADALLHVPADYVGLSNERLAKAIVDSIEGIVDGPRKPDCRCAVVDIWTQDDRLAQGKTQIIKKFAAEKGIPVVDVPLAKEGGFTPFGEVEDDGFITVYASK